MLSLSFCTPSVFTIALPGGALYGYPGRLYLLDRAVDPQTGTIKARLVFANPKKILKPGVTTNILIKHNGGDSSLLIPYKAIVEQLGENFVFVAQNNRALQHKVVLGTKISDKVVIKSGLKAGDSVITEGVQKLRDSTVIQAGPPKAPPR